VRPTARLEVAATEKLAPTGNRTPPVQPEANFFTDPCMEVEQRNVKVKQRDEEKKIREHSEQYENKGGRKTDKKY